MCLFFPILTVVIPQDLKRQKYELSENGSDTN